MDDFERAKIAINNAYTIAIICHINPDADTLGSGLALYYFLLKCGKEVRIFCDDEHMERLDFITSSNIIERESYEKFNLVIPVDCSDLDRLGLFRSLIQKADNSICFDHHSTNVFFTAITLLDAKAASTAEYLYKFLSYYNSDFIDDKIAALLYAGILADSGGFYFSSTSSSTHEVVASLMHFKFDANNIYYELYRKVTYNKFLLSTRILNKAKFYDDNKIAIATFMQEDFDATNTDISCTEGVINSLQNIAGVKVSIAITEASSNSFKISLRSDGEVDVADCAGRFGGGGHHNASGCRLSGNYYDIIDKLLRTIREVL